MEPSLKRGFTLVELLVVIAIIAVLSVIVLAALGLARSRGNDAGIKAELLQVRSQASLFYEANSGRYVGAYGSATDVCSPSADGSATDGTKGVYEYFLEAAEIAGLTVSDLQFTRTQVGAPGKATCHACLSGIPAGSCGGLNSNAWAAEVPLKGGGFWCVDSSGYSAYNAATALASGDARCL